MPVTDERPGLRAIDRALARGDMDAVKRALFALDDEERILLEERIGSDALARCYRSARGRRRGPGLGRVVVLPGLMGTQLESVSATGNADKVWVNFFRIIQGRIDELKLTLDGRPADPRRIVRTAGLYKDYLPLLLRLEESWQVRPFGYDWRMDIDLSARALAEDVKAWAEGEPVHLLVHSMGGLVARRFIQLFPDVWQSMRDPERRGRGGRLVMLGTPNRGSFAISGALTGEEGIVKTLAKLDFTRGTADLLPILNTFLGSYQTLPSPRADLGDDHLKLFDARSWGTFPVFQPLLDQGKRFQEALHPVLHADRLLYVAGYDQETPARVRLAGPGQLEYQTTRDGDGRVTHELGLLEDVATLFVHEKHGDLVKNEKVLAGVDELLANGSSSRLESRRPVGRGASPAVSAKGWTRFPAHPVPPEVGRLAEELRKSDRSGRVTFAQERAAARLEALLLADQTGGRSRADSEGLERPRGARPAKRVRLAVEVVWGDLTKVAGDVYAVGHYYGVRPQNAVAALDRAVSRGRRPEQGLIAEHVRRGLVRAELGTVSFFPWGRRTIAIAGMGHSGTFGESQLRTLARSLTWAAADVPGARTICAVLIGSGEGNLDAGRAVGALFGGMVEALHDGPVASRVTTVRIVERRRDRAREIHQRLREIAAELAPQVELVVGRTVRVGPGGVVGAEETLALLTEAAASAIQGPKGGRARAQLTGLLAGARGAAGVVPRITATLAGLRFTPDEIRFVPRGTSGLATDFPTRLSFAGDPRPYRVAAITNTAVVPERPIGIDPSLVAELALRMIDPDPDTADSLADLLRRLLVPGDFQWLLRTGGPYVFEVDRAMAPLHFEMMALDEGPCAAGGPLAIQAVVARQLRTAYSAPPSPPARSGERLRALVIGDPGDPAQHHSLPGARKEAERVVEVLRAHDVDVTAHIGAPGSGQASSFPPADRLECLHLMMKGGFDILHYAGHGDFDAAQPDRVGWVFKSGLLTARELAGLSAPPRLVVANACLSARTSTNPDRADLLPSLADEFFRRGVRDYVGTAWEVNDEGAVTFAERLYEALLRPPGAPLGEAVREARRALWGQRSLFGSLWAAYQHYGDPAARLGTAPPETKAPRRRARRS